MRSVLTRAQFRQLARGQILRHSGCQASAARNARRPTAVCEGSTPYKQQKRSFFGLFDDSQRISTKPKFFPGFDKLLEHSKRLRLNARLDSPEVIERALSKFLQRKYDGQITIADREVAPVLQSYQYLRRSPSAAPSQYPTNLPIQLLLTATQSADEQVSDTTSKTDALRVQLAVEAIRHVIELYQAQKPGSDTVIRRKDLESAIRGYLNVLCRHGLHIQARDIIIPEATSSQALPADFGNLELPDLRPLDKYIAGKQHRLVLILQELARRGDEKGLVETVEVGRKFNILDKEDTKAEGIVSRFFAEHGRATQMRDWYERVGKPIPEKSETPIEADPARVTDWQQFYRSILRACYKEKDEQMAERVVRDILNEGNDPAFASLALYWAALKGQEVEEIERMVDVLLKQGVLQSDANIYNPLIEEALLQKNYYQVERYLQAMEGRGIEPDKRTYALQISNRLANGEINGALKIYGQMQYRTKGHDTQGSGATTAINLLVREMCHSRRHNFDSIMTVVADLVEGEEDMEAQTVATLSVLHLSRDEMDDVADLINTNAALYSVPERESIVNAILEYCAHEKTSGTVVWEVYRLLREAFDDMDRAPRIRFMRELLNKNFAKEGIQVFEHMQMHGREDTVPTMDTWVECAKGVAQSGNPEAFNFMHNLIKVDTSLEPSTALHNAMMHAAVRCGETARAIDFWDAIATGHQGPDINSIRLIMEACQVLPFGHIRAKNIHDLLERSGFQMRPLYYAWYLAALGSNGQGGDALELIRDVHQRKGLAPTVVMFGWLLNSIWDVQGQSYVLGQMKERYPALLAQLEACPQQEEALGRRQYDLTGKQ